MRPRLFCLHLMLVLSGMVGTATAHPGHGTTDPHSVTHYVAEPVHAAPLLALFAAAAVAISLLAARRRSR